MLQYSPDFTISARKAKTRGLDVVSRIRAFDGPSRAEKDFRPVQENKREGQLEDPCSICILCIQVLHLVAPWLEPGLQPPARVSRNRCVLAPVCHGVALNPGPGDHRVLCIVCIAFDLVVDWDARTSAIAESYSAYRASEMNNYG